MDIISHALWSAAIFFNTNPWLAVLAGVLPDLLAFTPLTTYQLLKREPLSAHHLGTMRARYESYPRALRLYANRVYQTTHSLLVASVVIGLAWTVWGVQLWLLAWPLHILIDVPLHQKAFFGTRIFWPLSNWAYDGMYWSNRYVLIANAFFLLVVYTLLLNLST